MHIQVLMYHQDDPKKCTAAKLVKFGIAKNIKKTTKKTLVLHPFSKKYLLPSDKTRIDSITGIDCSWNNPETAFDTHIAGILRKLPPLLAGNPVNYSKLHKLTTAEAIAGALYILGFDSSAKTILEKFKWGHTFFELNSNLLNDYSLINDESQIMQICDEYSLLI